MIKATIISLFVGALAIVFPVALAQESVPVAPVSSPSPIEYSLPYPGLLPDHPLYPIKMLRDQLLMLLISNPVRKVEFSILMADKRLNMSSQLFDKHKEALALKTLSESVSFLQKAEEKLFEIPMGSGADVNGVKDRFEKSVQKHIEVVSTQAQSVQGSDKESLQQVVTSLTKLKDDYSNRK